MAGLAPLVVITLVGMIVIAWVPGIAAYLWFALAGNISGAAGDVMAAKRLQRLPKETVVEDTETGYIAWSIQNERF